MAETKQQYALTKHWIKRFEIALGNTKKALAKDPDNILIKASSDGIESVLEELRAEAAEYEAQHGG